ncbi:MAG: hypothetical protein NWE91_02000 [Candidatus Bathyarchaeota archaeon]|nr:hypothetical protein [Candidatus Bathyarchaeota archaeon]
MDYDELFDDALNNVLEAYSHSKIQFYSERDLQGHLFYECRKLMEERGFPLPLKLYAEKSVFQREKVDLVLGNDEILVELKLEPDYPGVSKPVVFSTNREAEGAGSVESDLKKVAKYAGRGKCAHFVMIDEDGRHRRRIAHKTWKPIYVKLDGPKKLSYLLHVKHDYEKC